AINGSLTAGVYKLITYSGALSGSATGWQIGANNDVTGHGYTFSSATAGEFDLIVTNGPQTLTWTGRTLGGSTANTSWDTAGSTNWANPSNAATSYSTGSTVTFGDSNAVNGANPPTGAVVIQAAGVAPASVTFSNNSVPYSLSNASGTIGIAGATGLAKTASATRNR